MERRLYEASLGGNITSLMELLVEEPLVLDRAITTVCETPLHIAAMYGHVDFATKILSLKPELTSELTSQGFSALHLASTRKNINMVKVLLAANPDVCELKDQDGRTPLHLAAMKGRIENMKVLIQTRPEAVQVLLDRRETILHLCVKHNRLEALKLLMLSLMCTSTAAQSVSFNSMDDDGNTILHIVVAKKQMKMIRYLIRNVNTFGLEVNAINKNGFTALDVLAQSPIKDLKDIEIGDLLRDAGGVYKAWNRETTYDDHGHTVLEINEQLPRNGYWKKMNYKHHDHYYHWLRKKKTLLIVVASLIATMAFQAGLNPPGGVWQDDSIYSTTTTTTGSRISPSGVSLPYRPHVAGTSVMAANNPIGYLIYMICNTIGFLASLSIILLLVSGLPVKRRIFFWVLMAIICVAITCTGLTYLVSLLCLIPLNYDLTVGSADTVLYSSILAWLGIMGLVFFLHMVRFVLWLLRKLGIVKKGKEEGEKFEADP